MAFKAFMAFMAFMAQIITGVSVWDATKSAQSLNNHLSILGNLNITMLLSVMSRSGWLTLHLEKRKDMSFWISMSAGVGK